MSNTTTPSVVAIGELLWDMLPDLSLIHISEPTRPLYISFFFNDTATTEIYTRLVVGSVRCV